jgi:hypothetical protein
MSDDANNGAEVQRRVLKKLRARVKSCAVERVLIAPKHVEYRIVVKELFLEQVNPSCHTWAFFV